MIILNMPQGSLDWLTARLWRLTASEMKSNITSTGKLSRSKAAIKSIDRLIAGLDLAARLKANEDDIELMDDYELKKFMSHYTGQKFAGSLHTERGHEFEADALAAMSARVGSQLQDVGMCLMGDDLNSVVSCSPDAVEMAGGKMIAGAEVKNPCLCNYYNHVVEKVLPDDYKMQIHSGMAICDVDTWHFGSHFKGKPLFYHKVKRENFTDILAESLNEFRDLFAERHEEVTSGLRDLGELNDKQTN